MNFENKYRITVIQLPLVIFMSYPWIFSADWCLCCELYNFSQDLKKIFDDINCFTGIEIGESLGGSNKSQTRLALIAAKRVEYARYLSLASISAKVALATSLDNKRQLHLPAQLHGRWACTSYARVHSTADPRARLSETTALIQLRK